MEGIYMGQNLHIPMLNSMPTVTTSKLATVTIAEIKIVNTPNTPNTPTPLKLILTGNTLLK